MVDKIKMNFYVIQEYKDKLEQVAQGRPLSYMINEAIKEWLERNGE